MRSARAAVATVILAASPVLFAAPCAGFSDVDDTSPFCVNVEWVKNRGITLGCAADLYCPADNVSRLQMAAFMNRLGNSILPPNVIWVAAEGGQFQSIQAAIDYASTRATFDRPIAIHVAPGTYNEAITLATDVHVRGSGRQATTISYPACSGGVATVIAGHRSSIRDLTVANVGGEGSACVGVYITNSLLDAKDFIQDVAIRVQAGPSPVTAIRIEGTGTQALVRDVDITLTTSPIVNAVGVSTGGGFPSVELDRVTISATPLGLSTGVHHEGITMRISHLTAKGLSYVLKGGFFVVRESQLSGTVVASVAGSGNYIFDSLLMGTVELAFPGSALHCFQTYELMSPHSPFAC